MSSLFDSLRIANSGLDAAKTGLDVTGQNIANINTPGYVRRTVVFGEVPPTDGTSAGRGVEVVAIEANRSELIDGRIGHEEAGLAHDAALLDGMKEIESAIGLPGSSLDANLNALFDAFSELASNPTSPSARDFVVRQAQILAQGFNALSGRISEAQRSTDASVRDAVTQLNHLTEQFAHLNGEILTSSAGVDALKDERAAVLAKIQELVDVSTVSRADGAIDLTTPHGEALVVGADAYAVEVVATSPSGFASLRLHDFDITSQLTGGRLGGLMTLRDSVLPGYGAVLDQFASDVVTQVNMVHSTGYDADGNPAGAFFAPLAAVGGAAKALAVDATLAADSQRVAASSTGAVGDNQTARALAGMRDARVFAGGTATAAEAWSNLAYVVGADVARATSNSATKASVIRQLQQLRDQASGVSLDEEAANLMRFQRSYEANARFFMTVNDTLTVLMGIVGLMRIIYDVLRDGLFAINAAASQLARAQQEVATGRRILGAGDNPRGTQEAIEERSTLSGIDAYTRTSDAAAVRLASADSVLTAYSDKLTSAMTTALGAQGSQTNATVRATAAATLRSLRDALVSDLNTTLSGNYLFSGTNSDVAAYVQMGGAWTYQGNSSTAQVDVESGRTISVSFDGQSIAQGGDTADVFTALDALATAVEAGDNAAITVGLAALQRGFDRAQRAQALLGSDEESVDASTTRLRALAVASEARRAKLEDANMAEVITKLTRADTSYRAALGAVSSAERQSLLDYLR